MGVYIKGVTKLQLMKVIINSTEFMPDDFEIIEVKTPHGRLIDADALLNQWCDEMCKPKPNCEEDCAIYEYVRLTPTVIETEVE